MNESNVTPGRKYYVMAVLVLFLGVVSFVWFIWSNVKGLTAGMPQFVMPGTTEINLPEAGSYTVFHEYESVVGRKVYSTRQKLSGLECALVSTATGDPVPLGPPGGQFSYSMSGRSGVSVWSFNVKQPGVYRMSCSYPSGREEQEVVLTIDRGFGGRLAKTVVGGLAIFFGSIMASLAIFLVTLIKRSRAKRVLAESRYPPPIG